MKTFLALIIVFFYAIPLYADQALVLTELEQIQEKVWYLQRDLAEQKASHAKHLEEFKTLAARSARDQKGVEERLTALTELMTSQAEKAQQVEKILQGLQNSVTVLVNEINRQNAVQRQQAEKQGTQEEQLQALRDDLTAVRQSSEQALAGAQQQLAETRAQLEALHKDNNQNLNQVGLYIGGAALAMAVLLTIGFIFLNSKSNRRAQERKTLQKHEL